MGNCNSVFQNRHHGAGRLSDWEPREIFRGLCTFIRFPSVLSVGLHEGVGEASNGAEI